MINRIFWLKMADKAKYIWNNYAWKTYYIDIEFFCKQKANKSNK
jgi:hypothetical protein